MGDIKITGIDLPTSKKFLVEKTTPEQRKEERREEIRAEINNERLFYLSMPTKQLLELIQQGQQKENPDPSRAEAYRRVEERIESKVNRLT